MSLFWYVVQVYVMFALAKSILALSSLPCVVEVYYRYHVNHHGRLLWTLLLSSSTVLVTCFAWPLLLYREGLHFFLIYPRYVVMRDTLRILRLRRQPE